MARSLGSLIPSIEQRESAWLHMQERLAHLPLTPSYPTVTISRQYGCAGYPLAQRLQGLLEEASGKQWLLFDKAILDKVASEEKVSRHFLDHLGDESHAQDVLRTHFGFATHNDAYAALVKHVVQFASAGCAIIVGRGGAIACQGLKNCFHFRLVASPKFRAAMLARRLEISLVEAEGLIRTQSKLREKFIKECLHADITSSRWFDAVFNNERLGVETIAQACLHTVMDGWPDKGFFRHQKATAEALR